MKVYLGKRRVDVDPGACLGKGGEAEVFDIGGGLALKLFKAPNHPDFASRPADQAQAALRLDEHQRKLPAFPAGLPDRVVAPGELATDRRRNGRLVGYAMRRVDHAEPLHRFAEPRFRRTRMAGNQVVAALRDLRSSVESIHGRGVVIGDFNDLNVLVAGDRAYLIDADSFQYGSFPCRMFTERFVDPARCQPGEVPLVLAAAHDESSDWYALAVMAFRSLLCVDPFGGAHRPAGGKALSPARRRLAGITVFDADVVYPKPAVPVAALPDDLVGYFREVFEGGVRRPLDPLLLDDLRWTLCAGCGREHARGLCPWCSAGSRSASRALVQVRGSVTAERIAAVDGVIVDCRLDGAAPVWLSWDGSQLRNHRGRAIATTGPAPGRQILVRGDDAVIAERGQVLVGGELILADVHDGETQVALAGRTVVRAVSGQLVREGELGDEVIGGVLAGQTRIWVGDRLGLAFYRAGALSVAALFDPDKTGVTECLGLPPVRGQLVSAACALGKDRAYLGLVEARGGREVARCALIDRSGAVVAMAEADAAAAGWLRHLAGACAVGGMLFVPTDDGIVRVEADGGALVVSREFPDTAPFVDGATRLLAGRAGLFAVDRGRIVRLTLSTRRTP